MIAFIGDVHRAFDRLSRMVDELPAEVATIVLAMNWFRTAWSRPGAQ